jgi:hypothetical protein
MIPAPQHLLRIPQKLDNVEEIIFSEYTEDFPLQTAHSSMNCDTVTILDASQTY